MAHARRGSCRASATARCRIASVSWSRSTLELGPVAHRSSSTRLCILRCGTARGHAPWPTPTCSTGFAQRARPRRRSMRVRVSLLGKSGEITARLKSLGSMDPDDAHGRSAEDPCASRARSRWRIADRKAALEDAELERKLATEKIDLSLPAPEQRQRHRPPGQPGDGRARGDLRRPRLLGRRRARDRGRNGIISPRSTCPRFHPARAMQDTFYLEPRDAGRGAARAAHPHLAGADPGDARRMPRRST